MDGIIAIGKAKKDIASALTGVASMVVGTDKQSIVVTTNDGATFRLNIPNPVDDPDLINRISVNSEGNVCLDGEELAWKEDIPVKVSELDNDENFIKLEALNKKLDKPEIEGTVGQVLTVQEDGTNAYANVPTYDDTELRELIGDIPIGNLSYEIVETLPEVTSDEAKEHTLYMIKSESDDAGYNQYIIVNGAYKKVGSTTGGAITGGAIIDDNTVSTTTVFSSNKIITDIQKCLSDSKNYTLQQLEKVKIDDTLTTTDKTIVGAINEVKLSIPTRTSDLENDSNFVTNSKMLEAITNAQLGNGEDSDIDLSAYQPIEESTLTTTAKTIPTAINELKSGLDDKVNKTDITTTIDSSSTDTQIPSAKATYDLADTKANTNHTHNTSDITDLSIPTKVGDLENDRGYLTSIPEEYITETELNAKGYLTSHQDISGLQTKTDNNLTTTSKEVVGAINELKTGVSSISVPTKVSQLTNDSGYLSTEDITSTINSTSTDTQIPTAKAVNVAIKGKLISQEDIDTYGKEIIKFPVGKWVIGSVAISNLTDLPNSYVRYIEIIGISEVTNPWTNNNTLRSYKATSYKGDTFLRSLNSGSEAGVIVSDTGWQRVLLNGDIIDNLTSTDTNKLLSANQGKILNDTKLNKTDANKLNCVTIDNVSLKEYILTNFTETEKTYYLIAKTTCTDLPKASNFYITVETPGLYTYKVTAKELNDSNGRYVCTYRTISSSWTEWEKVLITGDITTTISNSSTDTQVPSAKAVYDSISSISSVSNLTSLVPVTNLNDFKGSSFMIGRGTGYNNETTNIPNGVNGAFVVEWFPYANGDLYGVQKITLVQPINNKYVTFERSLDNNNWMGWNKVCTTTVADVTETPIEFDKTALGLTIGDNHSLYKVINGICYVTIELNVVPPSDDKTYGYTKINTTRLPKIGFSTKAILNVVETSSPMSVVLDKGSTDIKLHGNILGREGSCVIQGTFSYPVAE